jgi:VWFA-related protein
MMVRSGKSAASSSIADGCAWRIFATLPPDMPAPMPLVRPSEIIQQSSNGEVPAEVQHRAHVAFETTYQLLTNLEAAHNRRKAIVLISSGYDFDPFANARMGLAESTFMNNPNMAQDPNDPNPAPDPRNDPTNMGQQFADTDLAIELNDLAREANRANATFYAIDPHGLSAGQDLDEQVDPTEWETHMRKQQDSLRTLAEQTGGIAVVKTNDFDKALKSIDAETSDYYVLCYYSSNPDPTQRRRLVEIRVKKKDVGPTDFDVTYRREYTLKPVPTAAKPK